MKLILLKSAQKELDHLDDKIALSISNKILTLKDNPFGGNSKKLAGGKGYRIRIGNYRVIYTINKEKKIVSIIKIGHRKEIYK